MEDPDLAKVADSVFKTSYAQHLVREEAARQIDIWIKWRILPITAILGVAAAFFGWKADTFYTTIQDHLKTLQDAVSDLPAKVKGAQEKLETAAQQVDAAKGLIDTAREAAREGNQAAVDGAKTVSASFDLVRAAGQNVADAQKLLGSANSEVHEARNGVSDLAAEKTRIANELALAGKSLHELQQSQDNLAADVKEKSKEVDGIFERLNNVLPDLRRLRVFHIQVISTGRTVNIVNFADPDGRGIMYEMQFVSFSENLSGAFTSKLNISGRGACIFQQPVTLSINQPYELQNLKQSEMSPNCLPAGVRLTIDATPRVSSNNPTAIRKDLESARFAIVRVDTGVSESGK